MMHLYFFVSSDERDGITRLTIATSNSVKAYAMAHIYFLQHHAIGTPLIIAI